MGIQLKPSGSLFHSATSRPPRKTSASSRTVRVIESDRVPPSNSRAAGVGHPVHNASLARDAAEAEANLARANGPVVEPEWYTPPNVWKMPSGLRPTNAFPREIEGMPTRAEMIDTKVKENAAAYDALRAPARNLVKARDETNAATHRQTAEATHVMQRFEAQKARALAQARLEADVRGNVRSRHAEHLAVLRKNHADALDQMRNLDAAAKSMPINHPDRKELEAAAANADLVSRTHRDQVVAAEKQAKNLRNATAVAGLKAHVHKQQNKATAAELKELRTGRGAKPRNWVPKPAGPKTAAKLASHAAASAAGAGAGAGAGAAGDGAGSAAHAEPVVPVFVRGPDGRNTMFDSANDAQEFSNIIAGSSAATTTVDIQRAFTAGWRHDQETGAWINVNMPGVENITPPLYLFKRRAGETTPNRAGSTP